MVPSIGGGTKRSETLRAASDEVAEGKGEGDGDSIGAGVADGEGVSGGDSDGVGDSCANAVAPSTMIAMHNLSIISPVEIREKIVA